MRPNVLAFIPARGGSKGIPNKNLYPLAGKPLIFWTIAVALQARCFTRIVVSTDSREIAAAAVGFGAEAPFLRPAELAQDTSLLGDAIAHALARLEEDGFRADIVVELYPTHPFRSVGLVRDLTARLADGAGQASTVRPVSPDWDRLLRLDPDGTVHDLSGAAKPFPAPAYRRYGLFNGWRVAQDITRRGYVHPILDPVELIDIDEMEDMQLAEAIIARNLYDFGTR